MPKKSSSFPVDWETVSVASLPGSNNRKLTVKHSCGYSRTVWANNVKLLRCPHCSPTLSAGTGERKSTLVWVLFNGIAQAKPVLNRLPFVKVPKGAALMVPRGDTVVTVYRNDVSRYDWAYIKDFQTPHPKVVDVPEGFVKQASIAFRKQRKKEEEDFLIEQLSKTESECLDNTFMLPEEIVETLAIQEEVGIIPHPSYIKGLQIPLVIRESHIPYVLSEGDDDASGGGRTWLSNNSIPLDAEVDFSIGARFRIDGVIYAWLYVSVPRGVNPTPWIQEESALAQCLALLEALKE